MRRMQPGEALEVRLRPRAGLVVRLDPERYQRRSGVKLSLLDLPFLPGEMRDVLPGGDPVAPTWTASRPQTRAQTRVFHGREVRTRGARLALPTPRDNGQEFTMSTSETTHAAPAAIAGKAIERECSAAARPGHGVRLCHGRIRRARRLHRPRFERRGRPPAVHPCVRLHLRPQHRRREGPRAARDRIPVRDGAPTRDSLSLPSSPTTPTRNRPRCGRRPAPPRLSSPGSALTATPRPETSPRGDARCSGRCWP